MATTQTAQPYRVDQYGFPAIDCPKCGGRRTIAAYHNVHQGVCFKCTGAGVVYPTKGIRDAAAGFALRVREAMDVRAAATLTYDRATGRVTYQHSDLTPGRVVRRRHRRGPGDPWRTVATYQRTAAIVGESYVDGQWRGCSLGGVVTFTDGTRETVDSRDWEAQPPPELLAEGERLAAHWRTRYEQTLARRAARA